MNAAAAKSLALLIQVGGPHMGQELVEMELDRSIGWIRDRNEHGMLASMCIFGELTDAVPYLVLPFSETLLDLAWTCLIAAKSSDLRKLAADTLRGLLKAMLISRMGASFLRSLIATSLEKSNAMTINSQIGLLIGCKLFVEKALHDDITLFNELCAFAIGLTASREAAVRCEAFSLLAELAAVEVGEFAVHYLDSWMNILADSIGHCRSTTDRDSIICSINAATRTVEVMGGALVSASDTLAKVLATALNIAGLAGLKEALMKCIATMAKSLKQDFFSGVMELLPSMLGLPGASRPLIKPVRDALLSIVENVPGSMPLIEDLLLDSTLSILKNEKSIDEDLAFACETISMFHFGEPLVEASLGCILLILVEEHQNAIVRISAASALANLLRKPQGDGEFIEPFSAVLEAVTRLLSAAASDPDHLVRLSILQGLNEPSIDFYLSANEPFHILLMILSSGSLSCRLQAIEMVGRISRDHIGLLYPHLRPLLLQTFADLGCSYPETISEEAAIVLSEMVKFNPVLIRNIVEPLLRVLSPRLLDHNANTATAVITTLTRLVSVNAEAFEKHALDLVQSVAKILADQSSSKRRHTALCFLSNLLRNVRGCVPFEKLAELLIETGELLKIELERPVRNEAIRLLGVIGALDPYKLRSREVELQLSANDSVIASSPFNDKVPNNPSVPSALTTLSEQYYCTTAVSALVKLLKDPSLARLHSATMQALLEIFQSMGVRSSTYLGDVMPILLSLLKMGNTENGSISNHILGTLASLIDTVGLHIRPFASGITNLCLDLWSVGIYHRLPLLAVLRSLAAAMMGETLPGLVAFTPLIVSFLAGSRDPDSLIAMLRALRSMVTYAQDYVHSIVLAIEEVFGASQLLKSDDRSKIVRESLILVLELADHSDVRLELPLIVPWIRLAIDLPLDDDQIRTLRIADRLACYIFVNFPEEMEPLQRLIPAKRLPMLVRLIHHQHDDGHHHFQKDQVDFVLLASMNDLTMVEDISCGRSFPALTTTPMGKLAMNDANLRKSWDPEDCIRRENWFQWIRRLEAELLKESPAPALRACSTLAGLHYPLARDLFNAAFVACWNELPDVLQDELVGSLELALAASSIPPEVMQVILNLAEFMERDDRPLPIDAATLGAYAMKCHAYAKALYYQEAEFTRAPSAESVEALISVASQLNQPDSAIGALVCAQRSYDIRLEESWYEKLQRWDDALAAYQTKWHQDPESFDSLLGILRCWHALGDWDALGTLAAEVWSKVPVDVQEALIPLAASAAWSEGNWDRMAAFVEKQAESTAEGAVFRAVLAINRQAYAEADRYIEMTRGILDTELIAMLSESYGRAYNTIVRSQTLAELEEVIQFCQASHDIHRRDTIKSCWSRRLDDCQLSVDVWQRILKIRSLVLPPEEALARWIKLSTLCRRNDRPLLAQKILLMLLRVDENKLDTLDLTQASSMVVYGFLKHNWEIGERELAVRYMKQYARYRATTLDRCLSLNTNNDGASSSIATEHDEGGKVEEQSRLLARCHFKLGEWQKTLALERGEELGNAQIESYLAATSYDKTWYRAWHGWALVNFEMAMAYEQRIKTSKGRRVPMGKNPYLVPAIQGFFRSISLSDGNSLQDSLRLLTLWFKYGMTAEVNAAIGDGFHTVPVDNWLQVIPQLIARIHTPSPQVRRLIHHLLADIGRQHPQALIYPLTVASKSQSVSRRTSALAILDKMKSHSARLVEQALLVSQELIRTAILWEEMWYEGLEEASKSYFCNNDFNGMAAILEPLHQLIEGGHETARERSFIESYGGDLKEAREQCLRYKRTGNSNDLSAAWEIYHQVFRRISKQLPHIGPIDLDAVSPKLLSAKDLDLAIPGSYRVGMPVLKIAAFHRSVGVISSKQRPRKLVIVGSDGEHHKYLLKGHEDLRQDQRVMQLFGLVNTLLAADGETRKRHLSIERFAVIPLSQNTGLIGWVPHCDTIHSLIRDYREGRGVLLSIEHRLMMQFAPDYDNLLPLGKIEVFEHAMANTDGRDLGSVIWHRSLNAEVWLERRLAYTRSLAVMSMVGYVLGLGDRHPSNLMIDQVSGRVVHIDFGDCFEVAMQREKFPERIPFRLTRMLVRAMEVSGIEGTFRITCEHAMRVLRVNKDSLMAVLEAFVYDPLINWRLLSVESSSKKSAGPRYSSALATLDAADSEDAIRFPEDFSSSRRIRRDTEISRLEDESINRPEAINAGALNVINRVSNKLTGRDFEGHEGENGHSASCDVAQQVERLIEEAIKVENLCMAYVGWCAFW